MAKVSHLATINGEYSVILKLETLQINIVQAVINYEVG